MLVLCLLLRILFGRAHQSLCLGFNPRAGILLAGSTAMHGFLWWRHSIVAESKAVEPNPFRHGSLTPSGRRRMDRGMQSRHGFTRQSETASDLRRKPHFHGCSVTAPSLAGSA